MSERMIERQEKVLMDIDSIDISTNEGKQQWLHDLMQNQYESSYQDGDENADRSYVWPESQKALYGIEVSDQIKKWMSKNQNQGRGVEDLLSTKIKIIEDEQEKDNLSSKCQSDEHISTLVQQREVVIQMLDLLSIEKRFRGEE